VLQDNDPIKLAAVDEAKKRYESQVAFKKVQNQHYIREHALNVQHEQRVMNHENMDRHQKIKDFKSAITNQMEQDKESAGIAKLISRMPVKTHFGPEETEDQILDSWQRDRLMKKEQNYHLNAQMKDKSETRSVVKKAFKEIEHDQYLTNHAEMKEQQEMRVRAKQDVTQFWRDQVAQKNVLTQKERDAAAAYKKLPTDI